MLRPGLNACVMGLTADSFYAIAMVDHMVPPDPGRSSPLLLTFKGLVLDGMRVEE